MVLDGIKIKILDLYFFYKCQSKYYIPCCGDKKTIFVSSILTSYLQAHTYVRILSFLHTYMQIHTRNFLSPHFLFFFFFSFDFSFSFSLSLSPLVSLFFFLCLPSRNSGRMIFISGCTLESTSGGRKNTCGIRVFSVVQGYHPCL